MSILDVEHIWSIINSEFLGYIPITKTNIMTLHIGYKLIKSSLTTHLEYFLKIGFKLLISISYELTYTNITQV